MKKLIYLLLIIAFASCSTNTLEKVYDEDSVQSDFKSIEKIDSTAVPLILGTIMRYEMTDVNYKQMTYGEILADGKAYKAEQERLEAEREAAKQRALAAEAERMKRLTESVIVSCVKKGYQESDYREYITYVFAIENLTDKEVIGVKGDLVFNDIFEEEIKVIGFSYDKAVPAGTIKRWEATTDYNMFSNSDQKLKDKPLDKLKVIWKPEKIIFADGSVIE